MHTDAVLGFAGAGELAVTPHGVFLPAAHGVVVCRDAESFFWQPASGAYEVHCVEASDDGDVLCVTERRRAVSLHFFAAADLRKTQEVTDVAAVEVACVRFAHAGACVFVLCNVPTSRVQVLQQRERIGYVTTHTIDLPDTHNWRALHVAHFAAGSGDFVVLSSSCVRGYTLQDGTSYETCMQLVHSHDDDDDDHDELLCVAAAAAHGEVLSGTRGGSLLCHDAVTQSTRCVARMPDDGGVTALLYDDRVDVCVVGTATGRVFALSLHGGACTAPHLLCDVGARVHRLLRDVQGDGTHKPQSAEQDVCLYMAAADGVYMCSATAYDKPHTTRVLRRRTRGVVKCLALPDCSTFVLVCDDGGVATYTTTTVMYWCRTDTVVVVDACVVDGRHVALVCADGALRCYNVHDGDEVACVRFAGFRPRLCVSDGHGMLACCDDTCVRFFVARDNALLARGLLYANITSPVTVMRWVVDALFVIACGNGELFLLAMPPPCDADTQHAVEDVACGMWRLDFPVVDALPCFVSEDVIHLLVHSMDKDTKLYAVERRRDAEARVLRPLFLMHDHEGGGTCLTRIQRNMVLSAGKDGRVVLRDVTHYQSRLSSLPPSKEKRKPLCGALVRYSASGGVCSICATAHDDDNDAATAMAAAATTTEAVAAGRDAVVVRVRMDGSGDEAAAPDRVPCTAAATEASTTARRLGNVRDSVGNDNDGNSRHDAFALAWPHWREPRWHVATLRCNTSHAPDLSSDVAADDAVLREHVTASMQQLRDAWSRVMARCDVDVPVEELLLPDRRARFDAECNAAIADMRTTAHYDELYNAYVHDVIRRHCCDAMDVARSRVTALCTRELHVCNFAVRKEARRGQALLRKVALLRRMQAKVCAGRRHTGASARNEAATGATAPGHVTTITTTTATTVSTTTASGSRSDDGQQPLRQAAAVQGDDSACRALEQLLRPCTDVYTEARAAVQMMLLHGLVVAMKDSYNAQYDDLRQWRRHVVSEIRDRNRRCAQIAKQLGTAPAAFFDVAESRDDDDDDHTSSLFSVHDDELPAEVRALIAGNGAARRRGGGNDVCAYAAADEAALRLWMDGLEKDVHVLRVTVQPPDFLDATRETYVPPDERSDAQVQLVEAYEKQLAEETAAVTMAQEALRNEFAALQRANAHAAHAVDDALSRLRQTRLSVCERVHATELQLLATLQHRVVVHDMRQRYRGLVRQREDMQTSYCAAATHMRNRHMAAVQARAAYDALQSRNAAWLDVVRAMPPFSDARYGDKLHRRVARWKHRLDEGKAVALPQCDVVVVEDVTAEAWALFCQHCDAAMQLRSSLDEASAHAQQQDSLYTTAKRQCDAVAARIADVDAAMQELYTSYVRTVLDTPVLYRVRQGQCQDARAVTSSELTSACLRWRSDVTRYNALIVASHAESSGLLQRATQRQQRVKLLQWQRERLAYEAATLAMELRQLHTLRVTRDMHDWLNGAATLSEEAAVQKVARHMELVNTRMRGKVAQLARTAARLRAQIAERAGENAAVLRQWRQLRSTVDDATAVKSVLDAHASEAAQHTRRVRELCTTSQLEQTARRQQEELLRLKGEVDRLRERTFPSFAVVSKRTM